ncbi:MAG: isoleucine--tRNA ligase, partial [Muribaculaceae bacterium]|nr:isoleucine--tRNA ligase [Muribaculaceae bacterium]
AVEALENLIKAEVNIKDLKIVDNEESGLVKRVKADFKKLGPKYGKIMKQLGKAITEMEQKDIAVLEKEGRFTFAGLEGSPVVTLEDVEVIPEDVPGWLVANDGNITVALDVTVTPELRNEGMARELINRIQNIRKGNDFDITDKVSVELTDIPEIRDAVNSFGDYIAGQVLAESIILSDKLEGDDAKDLELDGLKAYARVYKN